jgi:hypothetical protein
MAWVRRLSELVDEFLVEARCSCHSDPIGSETAVAEFPTMVDADTQTEIDMRGSTLAKVYILSSPEVCDADLAVDNRGQPTPRPRASVQEEANPQSSSRGSAVVHPAAESQPLLSSRSRDSTGSRFSFVNLPGSSLTFESLKSSINLPESLWPFSGFAKSSTENNSITPSSMDVDWISSKLSTPQSPSMNLVNSRLVRSNSNSPKAKGKVRMTFGEWNEWSYDRLDSGYMALNKAQVFDDEWKDLPEDEFRQICCYLAAGDSKFIIEAIGQKYAIDMTGAEGATQTDLKTGKTRKLRLLDANTSLNESIGSKMTMADLDKVAAAGAVLSLDKIAEDGKKQLPKAKGSLEKTKAKGSAKADAKASPRKGKAKAKPKSKPAPKLSPQEKLGPQSLRGNAPQFQLSVLDLFPHAKMCFGQLAENEKRLCDKFAVFYHSYSFAALIYEVQAAIAAVLFRFRSQYAPLPRLLVKDFDRLPSALHLLHKFETSFKHGQRDHDPEYRSVAISAMCSLCALGPEASPPVVFITGYSQEDMSFRGVLEKLLEACFVPADKVALLTDDILFQAEVHSLDVSQFGGAKCPSGKSGHLLQIFIERTLVDELVYASDPWGPLDATRQPISQWLDGDNNTTWGQARIVAHPKYFMSSEHVRMYVISADQSFHSKRIQFQEKLIKLLSGCLGDAKMREKAATGIYGGSLPAWWTSEDQSEKAKTVPANNNKPITLQPAPTSRR